MNVCNMKSYTDLEQSQKLAEILPLESADMFHAVDAEIVVTTPYITYLNGERNIPAYKGAIPCWSLAALLDVLPSSTLDSSDDHHYRVHCKEMFTDWYDNPIDCCIAMIDRLHEQMIYDFNNS